MKRKISLVALSACAALTGASAQEPQQQQQEQHVVASPNPTIDDGKTTAVEPGKVTVRHVTPDTATTAAPMKKATRPKRKHKSRQ